MASPLKYRSAKQLDKYVQNYFAQCDEQQKKYTITGLALHLGMTRKMLIEYGERETFKKVIQTARTRIEQQVEETMLNGKAIAGCIFWLKNQGWTDEQQINVNDITQLTKDELINKVRSLADKTKLVSVKKQSTSTETSNQASAN